MLQKILLIRHAIPDDGLIIADAKRPLTEKGRLIQHKMAQHLIRLGHTVDEILYSPTLRTKETAQILAEEFLVPAFEEELLGMSYDESLMLEKIQGMTKNTALVGHAPSLHRLMQLIDPHNAPSFHLERSGTLVITFDDQSSSQNSWQYLSPKQILSTLDDEPQSLQ